MCWEHAIALYIFPDFSPFSPNLVANYTPISTPSTHVCQLRIRRIHPRPSAARRDLTIQRTSPRLRAASSPSPWPCFGAPGTLPTHWSYRFPAELSSTRRGGPIVPLASAGRTQLLDSKPWPSAHKSSELKLATSQFAALACYATAALRRCYSDRWE